jgi:hypothetical protein
MNLNAGKRFPGFGSGFKILGCNVMRICASARNAQRRLEIIQDAFRRT